MSYRKTQKYASSVLRLQEQVVDTFFFSDSIMMNTISLSLEVIKLWKSETSRQICCPYVDSKKGIYLLANQANRS